MIECRENLVDREYRVWYTHDNFSNSFLKNVSIYDIRQQVAHQWFVVVAVAVGALYAVSGQIVESKKYSGNRKLIYEEAQHYKACYDPRMNQANSIWYEEESDDLHISLVFETKDNALGFIGQLSNFVANGRFRSDSVFQEEPIPLLNNDFVLKHVYFIHYKKSDSSSPNNSRTDNVSDTVLTTNDTDPAKSLGSLEDLTQLMKKEMIAKCHIACKAHYSEYKNDPNNIIYGSHAFHDYFDGDGKKPPPGANPGWGVMPELRLTFIDAEDPKYISGILCSRINVDVTFRDPAVAKAMEGRWRSGSYFRDELTTRTFFYSRDRVAVAKYLRIKDFETTRRWRHADGEDVDFEETFIE